METAFSVSSLFFSCVFPSVMGTCYARAVLLCAGPIESCARRWTFVASLSNHVDHSHSPSCTHAHAYSQHTRSLAPSCFRTLLRLISQFLCDQYYTAVAQRAHCNCARARRAVLLLHPLPLNNIHSSLHTRIRTQSTHPLPRSLALPHTFACNWAVPV